MGKFMLVVEGELDGDTGRRSKQTLGGGKTLDAARKNADKAFTRNPRVGEIVITETVVEKGTNAATGEDVEVVKTVERERVKRKGKTPTPAAPVTETTQPGTPGTLTT